MKYLEEKLNTAGTLLEDKNQFSVIFPVTPWPDPPNRPKWTACELDTTEWGHDHNGSTATTGARPQQEHGHNRSTATTGAQHGHNGSTATTGARPQREHGHNGSMATATTGAQPQREHGHNAWV